MQWPTMGASGLMLCGVGSLPAWVGLVHIEEQPSSSRGPSQRLPGQSTGATGSPEASQGVWVGGTSLSGDGLEQGSRCLQLSRTITAPLLVHWDKLLHVGLLLSGGDGEPGAGFLGNSAP